MTSRSASRVSPWLAGSLRLLLLNPLAEFQVGSELLCMIYWFTGQPGSGKTTLAIALKSALQKRGQPVVHLDGEFLRELMDNKDFSEAGRIRNIMAAQQLAAKL